MPRSSALTPRVSTPICRSVSFKNVPCMSAPTLPIKAARPDSLLTAAATLSRCAARVALKQFHSSIWVGTVCGKIDQHLASAVTSNMREFLHSFSVHGYAASAPPLSLPSYYKRRGEPRQRPAPVFRSVRACGPAPHRYPDRCRYRIHPGSWSKTPRRWRLPARPGTSARYWDKWCTAHPDAGQSRAGR